MKKALICYHHGLGDVIMLAPHMRQLYNEGYMVDLMCRKEVKTSHLLDECPYVNKLIEVPNPWKADNYICGITDLYKRFNKIKDKYDWSGISTHMLHSAIHKIDITAFELKLNLEDRKLEVFISKNAEHWTSDVMALKFPRGYIHVHTQIENHREHNWDAIKWVKENLPDLPIVPTGEGETFYMRWDDINCTFELAKHATHRVYSSSVMVHAADAMGLTIDAINYGKVDTKVWPLDQSKVLNIRELGEWIKTSS